MDSPRASRNFRGTHYYTALRLPGISLAKIMNNFINTRSPPDRGHDVASKTENGQPTPRRRRRRVSSSRALTIRACAPKYIYIQVDNIKTNNRQLFWFRQYSTHVRRIAVRHFYVNAPLYFTEFHGGEGGGGCETFTATRELTLIRGHDNLCDRFATALFEYRWPGRKRVYHKVDFH